MSRQVIHALLVVLGATSLLPAADMPWTQGTYFQKVVGEGPVQVSDLLRDFSRAQGVPVVISENVSGEISIQYPEMPAKDYLDSLTRDSGLIWYYDGAAIHVSTSDELQSEVIPVGSIDVPKLIATLKALGVYSERFPITGDPDLGLLYVVGPKPYHDIINKIAASADLRAQQEASIQIDVEIFPLQYAWADDQVFIIGDNQVAVPGVATILRNVLSGGETIGGLQGQSVTQLPYNLPRLNGLGLIRPQNQAIANAQQAAINAQVAASQAQAHADVTTSNAGQQGESVTQQEAEQQLKSQTPAIIQADPRTNSVIVRDVRDRMDGYRQIIQKLDRPSGLVEIKATIVDLNADQGFQLGLPYHLMWNYDGRERSLDTKIDTTSLANLSANPGNLTISLMDDQVTQFFLNMQALESDGHARLVSKPSVVTINNIEAYLEETEEFYVRVTGTFDSSDLFNIKVGTKLYIVPHIVHEPDGRRVKLNVRIEDGSRSETAQVDEIPVISRNTINTQAVLLEGQSLLIGGLIREEETKTIQGLPVLARIPKVGALFRETVHSTARIERLVLLTPTIIDLPYSQSPDFPPEGPVLPPTLPQSPLPLGVTETTRSQETITLQPMSNHDGSAATDPDSQASVNTPAAIPSPPAMVSPQQQRNAKPIESRAHRALQPNVTFGRAEVVPIQDELPNPSAEIRIQQAGFEQVGQPSGQAQLAGDDKPSADQPAFRSPVSRLRSFTSRIRQSWSPRKGPND